MLLLLEKGPTAALRQGEGTACVFYCVEETAMHSKRIRSRRLQGSANRRGAKKWKWAAGGWEFHRLRDELDLTGTAVAEAMNKLPDHLANHDASYIRKVEKGQ